MKGANRPLLTKLIHQEVDLEIRQGLRSLNVEVDFHSDKVIQVGKYFMYHKRHFSKMRRRFYVKYGLFSIFN